MTDKIYSPELINKFVTEWEYAPPGRESFDSVCSRYPEEFRQAFRSLQGHVRMNSWDSYRDGMIEILHTSRTKLGRALK